MQIDKLLDEMMTSDIDIELDEILISDDAFDALSDNRSASVKPKYFRNKLSSNGGKLSHEEKQLVEEIFNPDDEIFIETIGNAFE